jgi:YebC/PmpR family DNA-binding regulatory protein
MGRVFEKRKYKMFARYDKMAKGFTKLGKEIAIAVKLGGTDPGGNPRLRAAMATAKGINMPKDRIEAAIHRAASKADKDLEEVVYEGYAPYGVGILLECATDNPTRTVANVRMYFNRAEGELGKTGSLSFMFERKSVFKIENKNVNLEELELELIDEGLEEIELVDNEVYVTTSFNDFGMMQKALESKGFNVLSAEKTRFATSFKEVTEEQQEEIMKMIDKMEEDDDVMAVYHNMK